MSSSQQESDNNKPGRKANPMVMGSIPSGMGAAGNYASYPISQYFSTTEGVDDHLLGFDVYAVYRYAANANPTLFFQYWDAAHNCNPWYRFSLDYLTSKIFTNYHFEGEGAAEVEKFWQDNNMYTKIRILGENTIKFGTGIAKKLIDTFQGEDFGVFGGIETMHTPYFQIDKNDRSWDEEWSYVGPGPELKDTWSFGEDYMKEFVILRPWSRPNEDWGYSPMQSVVHSLESLHALTIQDLPAACRNFMTAQRIYAMDLDNVDEDAQKDHMETGILNLTRFNAARASAVAIDAKNKLFYMGTEAGGGTGSLLEDVMGFIEPLTSCINLNIYLPIGILRQTGANRAIIKRQDWMAFEQMAYVKQYFADEIFKQIIKPHIEFTGDVKLVHDLPFEMQESRVEDAIKLYGSGIVPREYAQQVVGFNEAKFKEEFGITELTYLEDIQMEVMEEGAKFTGSVGGNQQPKAGVGTDTRQENEKGEEQNDSVSGSQSEVKG